MTFRELQKFIKIEDERIRKYFDGLEDAEKRTLARTVKLTEEVGELAAEVLAHHNWQRQEKMNKHSHEDLNHEFADVIITTFLLADVMEVNLEKAIRDKIKKIEKRYKDK